MTMTDIELIRMIYMLAAPGTLLFSSMLTRWLWRPLRFLFLAGVMAILFTPYFVEQPLPDGSHRNMVPAFVIILHDVANDREHWREAVQRGGKAIVAVAGVLGAVSLLLALILPKKRNPSVAEENPGQDTRHQNPYLPADFEANQPKEV